MSAEWLFEKCMISCIAVSTSPQAYYNIANCFYCLQFDMHIENKSVSGLSQMFLFLPLYHIRPVWLISQIHVPESVHQHTLYPPSVLAQYWGQSNSTPVDAWSKQNKPFMTCRMGLFQIFHFIQIENQRFHIIIVIRSNITWSAWSTISNCQYEKQWRMCG